MNKKAFTLIELLVVITIIGILSTTAVNIYTSQLKKARDATRLEDLKNIENSLYSYYADNEHFIQKPQLSSNQFTGGNDAATRAHIKALRDEFLIYLSKIPSDPLSGTQTVLFPKHFEGPAVNNLGTYTDYGYNTDNWDQFEISAALELKPWSDDGDDPHRFEIKNAPGIDTDAPTSTRYVNAAVPGFTCLGAIGNIYNSCTPGTFIVIKHTDDAFIDAFTP